MRRSLLSYGFLISFLVVILFLQWWQEETYPWLIWTALSLLAFSCALIAQRSNIGQLLLAITMGTAFALAAVARTTHVPHPPDIDAFIDGKRTALYGTIIEPPDRRPTLIQYTVQATALVTETGATIPVRGKVLVRDMRKNPSPLAYGDAVLVQGILRSPKPILGFRYDKYLSLSDIHTLMTSGPQKINDAHGTNIFSLLFKLKQTIEGRIKRLFPQPHASFLEGLLTGARRGMPKEVLEEFNIAGLTHLLAISGYNITIILSMLGSILFWIPIRWRLVPLGCALAAYTLLVGASASVVRASIMGVLGLLAIHTERQQSQWLAILWTMFLMLLWNPKYLWYDAGFQLSFLAVIGIMELSPILTRVCSIFPRALGIRDSVLVTLAAQIFTIPWSIALFGRFSLIAPLSNTLVAPFIPLAMLFGFLSVLGSFISLPIAALFSLLAWACLHLMLRIAHLTSVLPLASLPISRIHPLIIILYYAVLVLLLWRSRLRLGTPLIQSNNATAHELLLRRLSPGYAETMRNYLRTGLQFMIEFIAKLRHHLRPKVQEDDIG